MSKRVWSKHEGVLSECVFRERGVVMGKECGQSMRGCCQSVCSE